MLSHRCRIGVNRELGKLGLTKVRVSMRGDKSVRKRFRVYTRKYRVGPGETEDHEGGDHH